MIHGYKVLLLLCVTNVLNGQSARALFDSTYKYIDQGSHNTAMRFAKEAESLLYETDSLSNAYGVSLNNMASINRLQGNWQDAILLYQKALEITRRSNGPNSAETASMLNNLGLCYFDAGALDLSQETYLQLFEIINPNSKYRDSGYSIYMCNYALLQTALGNYSIALDFYQKSMNVSVDTIETYYSTYASILSSQSSLFELQGELDSALFIGKKSIALFRKHDEANTVQFAQCLANLGNIYSSLSQYDSAITVLIESKDIVSSLLGMECITYASVVSNLGLLYMDVGLYDKALRLLQKAQLLTCRLRNEGHPDFATSLNLLGMIYSETGQIDKAIPLYRDALKLREKYLGIDHPSYATSLHNLAGLLESVGLYKEAEKLYAQALDITARTHGRHTLEYAKTLGGLAIVKHQQGDDDLAIFINEKALMAKKISVGSNSISYMHSLNNSASFYCHMGDFEKALDLIEESSLILTNFIQRELLSMTEDEKTKFLNEATVTYQFYLSLCLRVVHSDRHNRAMMNYMFLKNLILDQNKTYSSLGFEQPGFGYGLYTEWIAALRELNYEYGKPEAYRSERLHLIEEKAEELEGQFLRDVKNYSAFSKSLNINIPSVERALANNSMFIGVTMFQYWLNEWTDTIQYVAYIVLPEDTNAKMVYLGNQYDFATNDRFCIYNVRGVDVIQRSEVNKQALSKALAKLTPYLKNIDTLYFSPSGIFNQVNVAALPLPDGSRLWDHYHVEIKSSVRELLNEQNDSKPKKDRNLLLFGGLNYNDTFQAASDTDECFNLTTEVHKTIPDKEKRGNAENGSWKALSWTGKEVKEIQYISASNGLENQVLNDSSGSEVAFKALDGNSPYVLHLATHGYFFENPELQKQDHLSMSSGFGTPFKLTEDPMMRSGLILAGANRAWQHGCNPYAPEDGILTAREISHMDLSQTELVVLSACQTGLGDIDNSEGVYGLQRAFKMAGVNYIIMSLWSVPDQETSELMIAFYSNWLEKKMPLSEAFYTAQKALAAKYPQQPELWAGFVLMQ